MSKALYFGGCAGTRPRSWLSYRRKSASLNAARVISARSYAEIDCGPRPSRPDGVAACVSKAWMSLAVWFISASVFAAPPAARASAFAESLPDIMNSVWNSRSTEYFPPGTRPTRVPSTFTSSAVAVTTWRRFSRGISVSPVSSLSVLAGRNLPCGSRAASTLPVSRSASTQPRAVTGPGSFVRPSVMTPRPAIRGPPTTLPSGARPTGGRCPGFGFAGTGAGAAVAGATGSNPTNATPSSRKGTIRHRRRTAEW
jgi:hypothetical protein